MSVHPPPMGWPEAITLMVVTVCGFGMIALWLWWEHKQTLARIDADSKELESLGPLQRPVTHPGEWCYATNAPTPDASTDEPVGEE